VKHFGDIVEATREYNNKQLLVGTIVGLSSAQKSKTVYYDVQWELNDLPTTAIQIGVLVEAIELAKTLMARKERKDTSPRSTLLIDHDLWDALLKVEDGEGGEAPPLDDEEEDDDDDENYGSNFRMLANYPEYRPDDDNEAEVSDSFFRWLSIGSIGTPKDIPKKGTSKLLRRHLRRFQTPLSSFFAFIPFKMFFALMGFQNKNAHRIMAEEGTNQISGQHWSKDVVISEHMIMWGMLVKMVLRPTPGESYDSCWKNTTWHPYTAFILLR
jgi:hypothetical protein